MQARIGVLWGTAGKPLAAMVLGSVFSVAQAQGYPNKPVRMVVPASPGTNPDTFTRTLAQEMSTRLGQTFYVENMPGAVGNIASANVAKAAPNGHTLLYQNSAFVVNPSL